MNNLQLQRDEHDGGVPADILHAARQSLLQRLGFCAADDAAAHTVLAPGVVPVVHHSLLERGAGTHRSALFHILAPALPVPPGKPLTRQRLSFQSSVVGSSHEFYMLLCILCCLSLVIHCLLEHCPQPYCSMISHLVFAALPIPPGELCARHVKADDSWHVLSDLHPLAAA